MNTCEKQRPTPFKDILLIDDDSTDVKLTKRYLQLDCAHNHIHVAHNGLEAVQFLNRAEPFTNAPRPDLILLDLNMPLLDGREVLHAIKDDPELRSIPVVILTTSDSEQDILGCYRENANSYITKPVDLHDYKAAVRAVNNFWCSVVRLPPK